MSEKKKDSDDILDALESVTKTWTKQRKAEERNASRALDREYALTRSYRITVRDAAFDVMEQAYLKASANGTLPALARQIMYAARPLVQEATGQFLADDYFTQTLLPEYMEIHSDKCAGWRVAYDPRGHYHEPHTETEIPLGTLDVRRHLTEIEAHEVKEPTFDVCEERYPTCGPENRYCNILFIEKEGFMPLFRAVQLAERYDIAIMSTKGMSVTAAREYIDELFGRFRGLRFFVLHDFDKSGFSIAGTLKRDTRRYSFQNLSEDDVVDLGLRIEDIDGLQDEVAPQVKDWHAARRNLEENGATEEEIDFLLGGEDSEEREGRRVELNAFTSDGLVAWIEEKLEEHGVEKFVPDNDVLADAFRRAREHAAVQKLINKEIGALRKKLEGLPVPDDLRDEVEEALADDPARTWDSIVMELAAKRSSEDD
jgi:hypothetical protein